MKKALIYIAMAAGLLLVKSCTPAELFPADPDGRNGSGAALSLGVTVTDAPMTKADPTRPGDDDGSYNENKVYTLDYFIFKVDPRTNTSTEAVIKGRFTFNGTASPQTVDLAEVFNETDNTCYVYTIANLPNSTVSPTNYFQVNEDGDLQHVVVSTSTTTTTLTANYATLQAIEVVSNFKTSLTEGKQFKAQESFVMAGLQGPIELTETGPNKAVVPLSRIASKISLDINVIKMIEQYTTNNVTQALVYQGTWFPNINHIQIYLNYANPAGLVSGSYANRVYQIGSYFSYERYAYIPSVNANGSYTTSTLARYQDTDATKPYYNVDLAGTIVVDEAGDPVIITGAEYPAFEVTGTPFYSYPTTWKTSDATAPFIKIIIPWVKYDIPAAHYRNLTPDSDEYTAVLNAASGFPKKFNLTYTVDNVEYTVEAERKTTEYYMNKTFGDEFFYKISVPAFLEGETSQCALEANKWYMINLDVAVLGSETDDASMTIDGSQMGIYVMDWSTPDKDLGGTIDGGRYLSTAKNTYDINAVDFIDIPVISSHPLSITGYGGSGNPTATYWTRAGGADAGSLTYSTTSSEGVYFTITPAANATSVTLEHKLVPFSTSFTEASNAKDIAMITYKFRIRHSDNANYFQDIIVHQYPSIYVEMKQSTSRSYVLYYYHNNNGTISGVSSSSSNNPRNNNNYQLGTAGGGTVKSTDMTIVTVKSLAGFKDTEYSNWIIGDPRLRLADAMGSNNYYTDRYVRTNQWLRSDLGLQSAFFDNYLVANVQSDHVIAPRIMLSSGNNTNTGKGTWKANAERCAGYQEEGYPAGRWRLPTEAEILFITVLADATLIENPFGGGSGYWAASGRYYDNGLKSPSTNESRSSRCVYDLWYWGEEAPLTNKATYTIMLPE